MNRSWIMRVSLAAMIAAAGGCAAERDAETLGQTPASAESALDLKLDSVRYAASDTELFTTRFGYDQDASGHYVHASGLWRSAFDGTNRQKIGDFGYPIAVRGNRLITYVDRGVQHVEAVDLGSGTATTLATFPTLEIEDVRVLGNDVYVSVKSHAWENHGPVTQEIRRFSADATTLQTPELVANLYFNGVRPIRIGAQLFAWKADYNHGAWGDVVRIDAAGATPVPVFGTNTGALPGVYLATDGTDLYVQDSAGITRVSPDGGTQTLLVPYAKCNREMGFNTMTIDAGTIYVVCAHRAVGNTSEIVAYDLNGTEQKSYGGMPWAGDFFRLETNASHVFVQSESSSKHLWSFAK